MPSHLDFKLVLPELQCTGGAVSFKLGTASEAANLPDPFFATDEGDPLTEHESEVMRRFLSHLVEQGSLLILAHKQESIVGMSFVDIKARQAPDTVIKTSQPAGIIERVRSLIEHQGIGQALLTNAEDLILQADLLVSEVGVSAKNLRARRIYERAGYVPRVFDAEERLPDFEGCPIYRYWRPNCILFKELY